MASRPVARASRAAWIGSVGGWARRFGAPLVGLAATLIAVTGSGTPSYWGDEAASVLSAERSVPSLLSLLGRIDAVHGAYYLFLHEWIGLVGSSEASVRLASAVAVGFAAAGTVVAGTRLAGRTTGILAGCVLAVLPIVTRLGMEARSYAFTMAASAWLTAWFIALVRRRESRWWAWAGYGIAFAGAVYLFLDVALLVIVQAAVLLAYRRGRSTVLAWLGASATAAALALPIIVVGASQRAQLSFLARRDYATAESVLVAQWFGSSWWLAAAIWSLVVAAVVSTILVPAMRPFRRAVLVGTAWVVGPTAALLAGNALLGAMYNPRYLSFCAPAVALLAAVGIRGAGAWLAVRAPRTVHLQRLVPLMALVVIVVVAAPGYLAQRGPFAKDHGADFRQAAAVVGSYAVPGDAIVFDQSTKPSRRPRLALDLYPAQFAGLEDVALRRPLASRRWLWDSVAPLRSVLHRVEAHTRVWAVESEGDTTDVAELRSLGYEVERQIPVHRSVVYELVRQGS